MTIHLRVLDSFAKTITVLYSSPLPGCCCSPILHNKKGSERRLSERNKKNGSMQGLGAARNCLDLEHAHKHEQLQGQPVPPGAPVVQCTHCGTHRALAPAPAPGHPPLRMESPAEQHAQLFESGAEDGMNRCACACTCACGSCLNTPHSKRKCRGKPPRAQSSRAQSCCCFSCTLRLFLLLLAVDAVVVPVGYIVLQPER